MIISRINQKELMQNALHALKSFAAVRKLLFNVSNGLQRCANCFARRICILHIDAMCFNE
jgi:hypothetical protein